MSRADRLEALIDKGFAKLDEGDVAGATRQLGLARRIDPRHPDVLLLDAELAAADGDVARALPLLEKVHELRPDDASPLISAAGLVLYSLDDPETALGTIDRALELCDDEDQLVAAVLVRADALLALERVDEAREALGELSSSAIEDPARQLQIGECHLAADDGQGALRWFTKAQAHDDFRIDALYAAGWAHEALRDDAAKIAAWRQVRDADAAAPWPPWRLPDGELERLAEAAFAELPPRARELLDAVPMIIMDLPPDAIVAEGLDPRLLGLIDGPDRVQQVQDGSVGATPVNIFLYAKNLEAAFDDPEELAEQIRITVLHETAHYFGLDEDEVAALGLE